MHNAFGKYFGESSFEERYVDMVYVDNVLLELKNATDILWGTISSEVSFILRGLFGTQTWVCCQIEHWENYFGEFLQ